MHLDKVRWLRSAYPWLLLLGILGLVVEARSLSAQPKPLVLENEKVRISLYPDKGGLNEIVHKPSGTNLRSHPATAWNILWSLSLSAPDGTSIYTDSSKMSSFQSQFATDDDGSVIDLIWRGASPAGAIPIPDLTVHAQIALGRNDDFATFWWAAENLAGYSATAVSYPLIAGIGPLSPGVDDTFVVPSGDGRMITNPVTRRIGYKTTYPSGPLNMQFMALLNPQANFLLRSEDNLGAVKEFTFHLASPTDEWSVMQINHFVDPTPRDRIELLYNIVLSIKTPVQGDWTDAADEYKRWARQQWWADPAASRSTPAWLSGIGAGKHFCAPVCIKADGSTYQSGLSASDNAALLRADHNYLGVPMTGLQWGWERYGIWHNGDFFPPAGGWSAFDAAVQAARANGNRWFLFMSPLTLALDTDKWKSGLYQKAAMKDKDQKLRVLPGDTPGVYMAQMDWSVPEWQDQIIENVTTAARHGVDLIQLDTFPQEAPREIWECYDPSHPHPPGRGAHWQASAWFSLLARIRSSAQAVNSDAALSGEYGAELYLPWMDLFDSRDNWFEVDSYPQAEQGWDAIPLFEYVYHPLSFFTAIYNLGINDTYCRVALSRALLWGQFFQYNWSGLPTDHNADPEFYRFLKAAAVARTTYAKDYLLAGEMLPSPKVKSPELTIPYVVPSASGSSSHPFPAVQRSAWRLADGRVGIVMTNIGTSVMSIDLPLEYSRLSLDPTVSYAVRVVGASKLQDLGSLLAPSGTYKLDVAPSEVLLVELTPRTPVVAAAAHHRPPRQLPISIRNDEQ